MQKLSWAAAVWTLAMTAASPVLACLDAEGAPHFGRITLEAGFVPDPHRLSLMAAGRVDLSLCGLDAEGFVSRRPLIELDWQGATSHLTIAVTADADTVLLVNTPDGRWHYSDDYRGTDPAIRFNKPLAGVYDIWVGTFDGSRRTPAQLLVTEQDY